MRIRNSKMKLFWLAFIITSFIVSCQEKPNNIKEKKTYSKTFLIADFNQLISQLEKHPQVNTFIPKVDWLSFIDTQKSKINRALTIEEFYKICLPVVAKIGCGHTNLYNLEFNSATKKALVYLPYKFTIENDKLYVIKNLSANQQIPLGATIITINDKPIEEIINFILTSISADGYNKNYKKRMASKGFTYYYHTLFGISDFNKITFKINGKTESIAFKCSKLVSLKKAENINEKLLDFKIEKPKNLAVIKIKSFAFYNKVNEFYSFIDNAFSQVKEQKLENIVIDLRGNQGGDPYCASYLLRAIANKSIQYYKDDTDYAELIKPQNTLGYSLINKPYILIDGLGFSSTGHFSAIVKQHGLGIFVGEELGSTYSCNGGQRNTTLTNTKFFLQVGQKVVDVLVDANRFKKSKGIMPDINVETNYHSIINNKDLVMEKIYDLIIKN